MGYITSGNRYTETEDLVLASSKVVTGTGAVASTVRELGDKTQLRATLTVVSLDGTLGVTVETSHDGVTYATVAAFTTAAAPGSEYKLFSAIDRFVRVNVTTFTGTTATFSLSGEAV